METPIQYQEQTSISSNRLQTSDEASQTISSIDHRVGGFLMYGILASDQRVQLITLKGLCHKNSYELSQTDHHELYAVLLLLQVTDHL